MGLFNLKGWLNEVKRLNSGNYAGWVSGSVAHVKQGHRRAIVFENNQYFGRPHESAKTEKSAYVDLDAVATPSGEDLFARLIKGEKIIDIIKTD